MVEKEQNCMSLLSRYPYTCIPSLNKEVDDTV